jgi:hypothetical protein
MAPMFCWPSFHMMLCCVEAMLLHLHLPPWSPLPFFDFVFLFFI